MQEELLWGIDLGGTKIEGVVLKKSNPSNPIVRKRLPTEAKKGYHHICDKIVSLVQQMEVKTGVGPSSIGIGIPGTIDAFSGKVKNANTTCLIGHSFQEDIINRLKIPVVMANDANCFALAETHLGTVAELVKKPESVFGIIMGTGVGSGIVVNGKVLNGRHGVAGEWGHNTLIPNGADCYCGKKGCVETVISGPALESYYAALSGEKLDLKSITAQTGNNEFAAQTIEYLLAQFGKAIAPVINILDPEVIVLGGGVGNISQLVREGRSRALPHVFNDGVETLFLAPKLGDSAGVFGAAFLNEIV